MLVFQQLLVSLLALLKLHNAVGNSICVPVVGIPVFRGVELMLRAARSAAQLACSLVIVQNGPDPEMDVGLRQLRSEISFTLVSFSENKGVSAAWNAIIKSDPKAPYWLIMNSDVAFQAGTTDDIKKELHQRLEPQLNSVAEWKEGLIQFGFNTTHGRQFGFVAFALTHEAVDKAGTFDENIYPAYFEDTEYNHRLSMAKIRVGNFETHAVIHGAEGVHDYKSGTVIAARVNDPFTRETKRAYNNLYVAKKWGLGIPLDNGVPTAEHYFGNRNGSSIPYSPYSHPFNDPALAIQDWTVNEGRIHFIKTGEKLGMYSHLKRTRSECAHIPPQLVIMGMHHTGSSLLSGLLQGAGLYTGNESPGSGKTDGSQLNPNGYFEDGHLYRLNEYLLHSHNWKWYDFCGYNFTEALQEETFDQRGWTTLLARFANHAPFSMKDPRMCMLFPFVRQFFDNPVCVILTRNPLEVLKSVQHWTKQVAGGVDPIALNDLYALTSLESCADLPTYHIDHADLMQDPSRVVTGLLNWLNTKLCRVEVESGPQDAFFDPLPATAVSRLWNPQLNFDKVEHNDTQMALLPERTRALHQAIANGDAFKWTRGETMDRIPGLNELVVCSRRKKKDD